jgi:Mg/Co/Ni transporter MgtE
VERPGDAAGLGCLGSEHASGLGSFQLRPSVGIPSCLSLHAALCAQRSLLSLPPPALASFKFAPALAASELINMQNHSVTH